MNTTPFTDQQLADARARQADAARQHLADTAAADQALLADDAGPDWRAVEHAENKLAFIDPDATAAVKLLDEQNDARGREIQRLTAQLTAAREQASYQREAITLMQSYIRKHFGEDDQTLPAELVRHFIATRASNES